MIIQQLMLAGTALSTAAWLVAAGVWWKNWHDYKIRWHRLVALFCTGAAIANLVKFVMSL